MQKYNVELDGDEVPWESFASHFFRMHIPITWSIFGNCFFCFLDCIFCMLFFLHRVSFFFFASFAISSHHIITIAKSCKSPTSLWIWTCPAAMKVYSVGLRALIAAPIEPISMQIKAEAVQDQCRCSRFDGRTTDAWSWSSINDGCSLKLQTWHLSALSNFRIGLDPHII